MTNVDLGDVVEILDPVVSPSVYRLRFSENFFVLPLVAYGCVFAAFQYSSFCIHGFVKIFATSCYHFLILLTESLRYGGKEFSKLQMLF